MNERLIANDEELLIVTRVLLSEFKERANDGRTTVFPPQKFVFPEEPIKAKTKKKLLLVKTGERSVNFSFESEETGIDNAEALRMLGVTLYHLVTGKSELNHESFLLDGYRRPLNSALWPIILLLLKKEEQDMEKIEGMIKAIDPNEIKSNIQLPQFTAPATISRTKTVDDTIRGLAGKGIKIIGHEGVANLWNIIVPQDIQIRYNEDTLQESIEANRNGEQWALAYYSGQSIYQMRQKRGKNKNNQPCFYCNSSDWYLRDEESFWAAKLLEPGYYLLNYNGKFAGNRWDDQEGLILGLGPMYERAHEFVVAETILSNFSIHNGERLLKDWYHWGKESGSGGNRVYVGSLDSDGLDVSGRSPGDPNDGLRVVLVRKFDF